MSAETSRLKVNADADWRLDFFERIQDLAFVVDASSYRFIDANESARKRLLYRTHELKAMTIWDILDSGAERGAQERFGALLRGGGGSFPCFCKPKAGASMLLDFSFSTLRQKLILLVARDVPEESRGAQEWRREVVQAQNTQKLESLQVLACGIAHDFNNVLTGILGHAKLVEMQKPDNARVRTSIDAIAKLATQASHIVKQLVRYSGKGNNVQSKRVDLYQVARDASDLISLAISKGAKIVCDLQPDLPAILGDGAQLSQLLVNLLLNASDAIGDVKGEIHVSTGVIDADSEYLSGACLDDRLEEGTYVFLEVSDTGCGMDEDTLDRLFDPFFTSKLHGHGLGMAMVMRAVQDHSGAIRVRSAPGGGTTVTILFPPISDLAGK